MKIKISLNIYLIFLSLIIAWDLWLRYIIPVPIKTSDVTNILTILFFLVVLLAGNMIKKIPFNPQYAYFLMIIVTSSIAAYVLFRQSLKDSLSVFRSMYIQYSIAIPLYFLVKTGKVKREQLYYTVVAAIRLGVTVYVIFFLLHTYVGVDILNISSSYYQRYGTDRYLLNVIMPIFLICNAFSHIYAEKTKLIDCYDILMVLYTLLYVTKMRFSALSCTLAILIGLFVAKKFDYKKILLVMAAICAAVVLLFYTDMGREFLSMVFGGDFFSSETDTIRKIGRVKHLVSFLKSPVFGLGYPHENCFASVYEFGSRNSYNIAGNDEIIYLTDNGIFDVLYIFGLSGIVWLISYFGVWLKKSIHLIKNKNISVYFIFIVALIIDMYTECNWFFFGMLFIGIFDTLIRTAPEE